MEYKLDEKENFKYAVFGSHKKMEKRTNEYVFFIISRLPLKLNRDNDN